MTPSPRRMTPLRQRMIGDMKLRNLSPHTVQAYVDRVATFAKHFGKSPEFLGPKEIRAYLVFLVEGQKDTHRTDASFGWNGKKDSRCKAFPSITGGRIDADVDFWRQAGIRPRRSYWHGLQSC
jgi:hypothetical protein